MYTHIYNESLKRAKHKIWIFSDLQQANPAHAKECLDISMEDFYLMGAPADMIWYLGDSVEGIDKAQLLELSAMQEKAFGGTGLPLCFAMGNHDLDYVRKSPNQDGPVFMAFYETVKRHEGWYTTANYTDPYFKVPLGDFMIYFFSDHVAEDKSWYTSHGKVYDVTDKYPHISTFQKLREEMKELECPIITASHYSYPGGNRGAKLFGNLLPLPQNVKMHFYGHAHIGDFAWAGAEAYRRISWVDWHDIPQINVSSFEHIRGAKCRSVFLHIYEDNSCGVFFRNHDDHVFTECYFPAKANYPADEALGASR